MITVAVIVMAVIVIPVGQGDAIRLAGTGAFQLAERAAFGQSLHMVMVAFLGTAHVLFEPEHLRPVLAQRAIHRRVAAQHLLHPFTEGVDNHRVIAQIARRQEFNVRMVGRHDVGVLPYPAHQHAGEEEIGQHHHAAEAQAHHMTESRFNQWERDAGINGFTPAKAEAFHQHPRDLGHIRVGIGIRGATADHHQQRVGQGNIR